MADSSSAASTSTIQSQTSSDSVTTITDVNLDSLAQCASHLSLQDLSNMAMTCKYFKKVAYSDSVWFRWFREHWEKQATSISSQTSGVREAYLARRKAVHQFKFSNPFDVEYFTDSKSFDHMIFDKNDIIFSQGPTIQMVEIDGFYHSRVSYERLNVHKAGITSIRLFPLNETSFFRSESQRNDNFLVTSSCDRSIRLWWKGSCQRCFKGHSGPVLALSDKLLGDGVGKVLASGGEDGTVRLGSLSSSGKCGQHCPKTTLYGHGKPIKLMSVAGFELVSQRAKCSLWFFNFNHPIPQN